MLFLHRNVNTFYYFYEQKMQQYFKQQADLEIIL